VKVAQDGQTWMVGKTEWEKEGPMAWLDEEAEALKAELGEWRK